MSIVILLNIKKQRTAKENIKQNIKNNTRARKFLVKHRFLLRIQTLLILLIRFRRLSNLYINHFFKSYFLTYYLLLLLLLILLLPCCFCSLHILLLTRKFWLYFFTNKLAYIHLKINILIFFNSFLQYTGKYLHFALHRLYLWILFCEWNDIWLCTNWKKIYHLKDVFRFV